MVPLLRSQPILRSSSSVGSYHAGKGVFRMRLQKRSMIFVRLAATLRTTPVIGVMLSPCIRSNGFTLLNPAVCGRFHHFHAVLGNGLRAHDKIFAVGAVAQLGERRVRNAKVGSSILLRSSIGIRNEQIFYKNCGRLNEHATSNRRCHCPVGRLAIRWLRRRLWNRRQHRLRMAIRRFWWRLRNRRQYRLWLAI